MTCRYPQNNSDVIKSLPSVITLKDCLNTIMILHFWTDRSGQTEQTQIKLLLQFPFWQELLDALLYGKATLLNFRTITAMFLVV